MNPKLYSDLTLRQMEAVANNSPENAAKIIQDLEKISRKICEILKPTNPQAQKLNDEIAENNPAALSLLSYKGLRAYFPNEGILSQAAQAKGLTYDATIGVGLTEDRKPMTLESVTKFFKLIPEQVVSYSPSYGNPELRKLWQQEIYSQNPSLNREAIISLPVVVNGLTNGLKIASELFVNEGDKIILPDCYWENYDLIFEEGSQGLLSKFSTFNEKGLNMKSIAERLNAGNAKKILLLNFPNNPTGYTPTIEEAQSLQTMLLNAANQGQKIVVILDDAYFGLSFEDNIIKESIFPYISHLHENIFTVLVKGESKETYSYGLRAAGITFSYKGISSAAAAAMENKAAALVRASHSNGSTPCQNAIIKSRESQSFQAEKEQNYQLLKARYQKVKQIVADPKYAEDFTPEPFNSGYFMCVKLKNNLDPEKVRRHLIENYQTGVIVISGLIRIAFSSIPTSDLHQIFENIHSACRDLSK